MKINKYVASKKRKSKCVASGSIRREENCTGRYLRGLMNQNGEYLMNIRELNILEINTKSYSLCVLHTIVKARTFESTNHKVK